MNTMLTYNTNSKTGPVCGGRAIDVMDKKLIKKKKWLERRKELHSWYKRAEAVGIAPLPAKRPTKGQRLAWEMSIIQAEEEQANTNAES